MPKIRYSEWVAISEEITKLRIEIVSQFKDFNSAQESFKAATDLKGTAWDSARNYFDGYKEVSEAIFNVLYTVDDVAKNYVSAFTSEVGAAENDLDTDRMEELKVELRHLQAQNDILMEAAAKALENVPFINKFFLDQSMLGTAKKIEILEKYQVFESEHSGDFQEVQSVIASIIQGLAALGNAGNFIDAKEGFKPIAWKDQEWMKKLQAYDEKNSGDRYEVVVIQEDHDGKLFAIYKNGKIDQDRTSEYNKMLAREGWEFLMTIGPEVIKVLIGLDDVEVLLDDNSGKGQKVQASIFLLLAITPADKIKDVINSAKMLAKGDHVLDGVKITAKQLEMLKDLDKTGDRVKVTKKASVPEKIKQPIENGPYIKNGKPNGRPQLSGEKKLQFEKDVYNNQVDPDGILRDPNTGETIDWKPGDPRKNKVDFGHTEGNSYKNMFEKYKNGEITLDELKEFQFNSDNFRLETPSANRSHQYE